jgi:hypothetical protein
MTRNIEYPCREVARPVLNRREMLGRSIGGLGSLALMTLLAEDGLLAAEHTEDTHRLGPHFVGKAKNVILLFMAGGPGQVDTFDPKPELKRLEGKDVPESIRKNVPAIKRAGLVNVMASPFAFRPHGQSGIPVAEILPQTARHVDDLCVLRSLTHRNPVHGPAECVMLTGSGIGDRPSLGAWLTYGLGSENRNLPAFLVMNVNTVGMQFAQVPGWSAGFLPPRYQGTVVQGKTGIQDVHLPGKSTTQQRREQLDLLGFLNERHQEQLGGDSELEARIRSYELAFRMQTAAPELFNLSGETATLKSAYGLDDRRTEAMGRHCLLARRMVERGVRFVQVRFGGWDAHSKLENNHRSQAAKTDRPIATLLADLKQRGLLDETLVIWAGEFGRTPTMEGRGRGRDHSPLAFSIWLAGGGVQGGQIIGQTDPLGYTVVEMPITPSDLYATILQAVGIDQHKLFYYHNGRKEIVTVLGGEVVGEVFTR